MSEKNFYWNKMPFVKRTKIRLALSAVIILSGIGMFTLAVLLRMGKISGFELSSIMHSFYTGLGGGFLGAGTVMLIKNLRLLRNNEELKKAELKETDERNLFVAARTAQFTFFIFTAALFISIIVAGLVNPFAANVLFVVLVAAFLIYLLVYIVCNNIY